MAIEDRRAARKPKADAWDGSFNERCQAYGCPLGAAVITQYSDYHGPTGTRRLPSGGVCTYHNAVRPEHWQTATRVLRGNRDILATLQAFDAMAKIEQWNTPPTAPNHDPQTQPEAGENTLAYKAKLRALVRKRIDEATAT